MEGSLTEETREYDLELISDAIRLEKFTFFCTTSLHVIVEELVNKSHLPSSDHCQALQQAQFIRALTINMNVEDSTCNATTYTVVSIS